MDGNHLRHEYRHQMIVRLRERYVTVHWESIGIKRTYNGVSGVAVHIRNGAVCPVDANEL
jgi:hypothetical protein